MTTALMWMKSESVSRLMSASTGRTLRGEVDGELARVVDDPVRAGELELFARAEPPRDADAFDAVGVRALDVEAAVADHDRVGGLERLQRALEGLRLRLGVVVERRAGDDLEAVPEAERGDQRLGELARLAPRHPEGPWGAGGAPR